MKKLLRFSLRGLLVCVAVFSVLLAATPLIYDRWVWQRVKPELSAVLEDADFEGRGTNTQMRVQVCDDVFFVFVNRKGQTPVFDTRLRPQQGDNLTIDSSSPSNESQPAASPEEALEYWRDRYLATHGWKWR